MRRFIIILLIVYSTIMMNQIIPVHSAQVKTVEGIIQSIAGDSIQVRGNYYDIKGVSLKDPSDNKLDKRSLMTGKKVEIFFQDNRIISILIYDYMVE